MNNAQHEENNRLAPDPLELSRVRPDLSAKQPVTRPQWFAVAAIAAAVAGTAIAAPWQTARAAVAAATVFYLVVTVYKLLLIRLSVAARAGIRVTPEELAAQRDAEMTVYSMLIPMYREPETVPQMIKALQELDYPADRKDVQFLLEDDDPETRAATDSLMSRSL